MYPSTLLQAFIHLARQLVIGITSLLQNLPHLLSDIEILRPRIGQVRRMVLIFLLGNARDFFELVPFLSVVEIAGTLHTAFDDITQDYVTQC